jgi:YegS/Rv2252/BmrU family lipid kinase
MIELKDVVFIFNPNSGSRKSMDLIENLVAEYPEVDYFVSQSLNEFDYFFRTEIGNYKVVVICGGDGTINTSLKYLVGKDVALAIFPGGSGNGFARELGFKTNLRKLLAQILAAQTVPVDLIKVNTELSCNVTGLGIDSYVTTEFNKSRSRGLKGYIYNGVLAYFKYKPIDVELSFNASTITGKFVMVCIANTRQFGSGAFIAPNAKYNDGLLEVVLIRPLPFYRLPLLIYRLFNGTLANSRYVEFIQTRSVSVKSNSDSYHVDGEPKVMRGPLDISIHGQINVIKTNV